MVGYGEPDLSNPEVLEDASADAVESSKLQDPSGVTYMPNTQEPFSGFAKSVYENGQKMPESNWKNRKVVSVKEWNKDGIGQWSSRERCG